MTSTSGGCHCGAIEVAFELGGRPEDAEVRACDCSFCRAHGARTASDPGGLVRLRAREPAALTRYRFAHGKTDFIICGRCGVFVAAVVEAPDGRRVAVVNVNALAERARFARDAAPVHYGAETADERLARRLSRWTPAVWEPAD